MNIKRLSLLVLTYLTVVAMAQQASAQQGPSGSISSDLVATGASVTKLADGFVFTEGPAVDTDGNVYFSDVRTSKTYIWTVDGELTTFREPSGNGNGMYFDRAGNLLVCESGNRRVTRVSMDGRVTVLADSYDSKKLNSPNDLWPDPKGGIYFSDPRFRDQDGVEQDGHHVYYIPGNDMPTRLVINDLAAPNGVLGTADGKRLYVADHGPNTGTDMTYVYDIQPDGSLRAPPLPVPPRISSECGALFENVLTTGERPTSPLKSHGCHDRPTSQPAASSGQPAFVQS